MPKPRIAEAFPEQSRHRRGSLAYGDPAHHGGFRGDAAKHAKARAIHICRDQTLPKIYQQIEEWR